MWEKKNHAVSTTVCSFKQEHKRLWGATTRTYVGSKSENLKCEGAPLLIGFNNSQVETLKAVIDHNINLDQKMKERSPSCKSAAPLELNYIWHMKRYHVSTGYQLLLAMTPWKKFCLECHISVLCVSTLLLCVCVYINWGRDWVYSAKRLVRKNWNLHQSIRLMRLSLVYSPPEGLTSEAFHTPELFSFPHFHDEWYSKAYFHSHIINTFSPTPASNIPNHFRQRAHAILDRHMRRRRGEELRQLSDVAAGRLAERY